MAIKKRILALDDDRVYSKFLKELLESWGYEVETVETTDQACYALGQRSFDVVLMDVWSKGEQLGSQFAKELKRKYPRTKLVLLSGTERLDSFAKAYGADAYCDKARGYNDYLEEILSKVKRREK